MHVILPDELCPVITKDFFLMLFPNPKFYFKLLNFFLN